ncbi:MAG: hypothetical protein ACTS4Y_01380 [Candidatus Hodgkinia cicadicola]
MFYDFRGFVRKLGRSKGVRGKARGKVREGVRFGALASAGTLCEIDQNGGWAPFDVSFILKFERRWRSVANVR